MKTIKKTIITNKRTELLDITHDIQKEINDSKINNGVVVIFTPHTTAGITINENADPDVKKDIDYKINKMIPENDSNYFHAEGNSDSHIKSSLFGPSLTLIIEDEKLILGVWQAIYFCEFDGPRQRKYYIKIISD
ncbi:MAG: secondary thiamine-phosphate synthase enzyme YjbQ [Candidatus Marinimicrobia bacterium]|nr:secondary thiamine-phosphate synthase enzyme YjbQ [Candidatus Neomarinimicrobiota bacterium]